MKVYFDYSTLGGEDLNKYKRVCATAKSARMVTDEYVKQRENAEKLIANKETERSLSSLIKKEIRDEKAVITAIERIRSGEYRILSGEQAAAKAQSEAASELTPEPEAEPEAEPETVSGTESEENSAE